MRVSLTTAWTATIAKVLLLSLLFFLISLHSPPFLSHPLLPSFLFLPLPAQSNAPSEAELELKRMQEEYAALTAQADSLLNEGSTGGHGGLTEEELEYQRMQEEYALIKQQLGTDSFPPPFYFISLPIYSSFLLPPLLSSSPP